MRIAVLSDTHGELKNLNNVYSVAVKELGAQVFIHLGDNYDDMTIIETGEIEIVKVPGIFSEHYQNKRIPNRIIKAFEGWRFLISHTKEATSNDLKGDIDPLNAMTCGKADVLLHGHTHVPEILHETGYIRINPGHLKDNDKRGYPPTYCILEVESDFLDAKIYSLKDGKVLLAERFEKKQLGK